MYTEGRAYTVAYSLALRRCRISLSPYHILLSSYWGRNGVPAGSRLHLFAAANGQQSWQTSKLPANCVGQTNEFLSFLFSASLSMRYHDVTILRCCFAVPVPTESHKMKPIRLRHGRLRSQHRNQSGATLTHLPRQIAVQYRRRTY